MKAYCRGYLISDFILKHISIPIPINLHPKRPKPEKKNNFDLDLIRFTHDNLNQKFWSLSNAAKKWWVVLKDLGSVSHMSAFIFPYIDNMDFTLLLH